jgi:hypothetical protein
MRRKETSGGYLQHGHPTSSKHQSDRLSLLAFLPPCLPSPPCLSLPEPIPSSADASLPSDPSSLGELFSGPPSLPTFLLLSSIGELTTDRLPSPPFSPSYDLGIIAAVLRESTCPSLSRAIRPGRCSSSSPPSHPLSPAAPDFLRVMYNADAQLPGKSAIPLSLPLLR